MTSPSWSALECEVRVFGFTRSMLSRALAAVVEETISSCAARASADLELTLGDDGRRAERAETLARIERLLLRNARDECVPRMQRSLERALTVPRECDVEPEPYRRLDATARSQIDSARDRAREAALKAESSAAAVRVLGRRLREMRAATERARRVADRCDQLGDLDFVSPTHLRDSCAKLIRSITKRGEEVDEISEDEASCDSGVAEEESDRMQSE